MVVFFCLLSNILTRISKQVLQIVAKDREYEYKNHPAHLNMLHEI